MLKEWTPVNMHFETIRRAKLLQEAKDSDDVKSFLYQKCKDDILFRFRNFTYTDKNDRMFSYDDPAIIPFIPFPFQEEAIIEIWESIMDGTRPINERKGLTNVFIEKSRQMGLSWLIMAVFVYWFLFYGHKYHVISQKEELVDKLGDIKSLFGKARFIINTLPKWMLPVGFDRKEWGKNLKYMTISRPDGTWAITWESANPNAGRSGTFNAALCDEFASTSNAVAINKALKSATPCVVYNSTPNWEWNEYYRMRKLTVERYDKLAGKMMPAEIKWLRYHWTDHPLRDQEWYDNEVKGMSRETIAQELDISYNTAIVWRVYTDFPPESTRFVYNPLLPLYVWIDNSRWWSDPHAVILAQREHNKVRWVDSIEANCSITDMANFMACKPNPTMILNNQQLDFLERYRTYDWQRATFISDPYDTHAAVNDTTVFKEYSKVWIYLNTPIDDTDKIVDKQEQIMITRNNLYKVEYNEYCEDAASAVMNARYPERTESSSSTQAVTKPIHDWTSHYRTAFEYGMTWFEKNPMAKKREAVELSDRPAHWNPVYARSI